MRHELILNLVRLLIGLNGFNWLDLNFKTHWRVDLELRLKNRILVNHLYMLLQHRVFLEDILDNIGVERRLALNPFISLGGWLLGSCPSLS